MPATIDSVDAVLIELTRRGIELQAQGDRLRFRPRSAMTPELVECVNAHKLALLTVLDGCDAYSSDERRRMRHAPADLRATVDQIKQHFPGAKVVAVRNPRQNLADLIRDARQRQDNDRALNLREAWRERAAIMEYDGNQPREQAEAEALADTLKNARE